ncbi:Protein Atp11Aun-Like [Manis pentadactyla]|nr:Protein Atp11Aun-Like [Manis pentadactyla]
MNAELPTRSQKHPPALFWVGFLEQPLPGSSVAGRRAAFPGCPFLVDISIWAASTELPFLPGDLGLPAKGLPHRGTAG